MGRRSFSVNLPCTFPGCRTFSHHEATSRAESVRIHQTTGKWWKCDEHRALEERLLPTRIEIVTRLTSRPSEGCGDALFWKQDGKLNGFGYAHGDGYHARTQDFPAGTILEVTARVILPVICPCGDTTIENPGPHIASCPYTDPNYDPGGF